MNLQTFVAYENLYLDVVTVCRRKEIFVADVIRNRRRSLSTASVVGVIVCLWHASDSGIGNRGRSQRIGVRPKRTVSTGVRRL